jgi:hypothetical protein
MARVRSSLISWWFGLGLPLGFVLCLSLLGWWFVFILLDLLLPETDVFVRLLEHIVLLLVLIGHQSFLICITWDCCSCCISSMRLLLLVHCSGPLGVSVLVVRLVVHLSSHHPCQWVHFRVERFILLFIVNYCLVLRSLEAKGALGGR